jgi:putative transposon-encoded protein
MLLTVGNPKLLKGQKQGYLSSVLHFAPADLSGKEVCPKRTVGCTAACLNTAGRGGIFKKGESTNVIQQARIRKTKMFFESRQDFMHELVTEIQKTIKKAEKQGLIPVFRLNGTSDLAWEKYEVMLSGKNIFQLFPQVQFYDYTKINNRKVSHIPNYHLTFSKADGNDMDTRIAMSHGMNVAVVFKDVPKTYLGRPVINGDETDLRFLDSKGVIVGLKAKGKAKKDTTGFVV